MLDIAILSTIATLMLGSIGFWVARFRKSSATSPNETPLLPTWPQPGSPFGFSDVVMVFFCWLFAQMVAMGLAGIMLDKPAEELAELSAAEQTYFALMVGCGQLLGTLLAVLVLFWRYRSPSLFGLSLRAAPQHLKLAAVSFLAAVPAILAIQWLLSMLVTYEHSTLENLAANANGWTISVTILTAVIIAPICEEVFFRGVLQAWLQRFVSSQSMRQDTLLTGGWDDPDSNPASGSSVGSSDLSLSEGQPLAAEKGESVAKKALQNKNPFASPPVYDLNEAPSRSQITSAWWPTVASASIFAMVHLGQGAAPVPLFFFGITLGYLYRKTGSVVPCIFLHMMLNGFSVFWFTMQVLFGEGA